MKLHPLFSWLSRDPGGVQLARLNTYCSRLGFQAVVVTHPAPCPDGMDLEVFVSRQLALYDSAYLVETYGHVLFPAAAWLSLGGQAGFLFVRPLTPLASALWGIGLVEMGNPLPVASRLSELCAPLLMPLQEEGSRAALLAQSELDRLDNATTAMAFDALADGLQLAAHGQPGIVFGAPA